MTGDLVRLAASLAQCEMALVRHDPVAAALLAQAARHAAGLARASDLSGDGPEAAAARKVVQALVRASLIETEAGLLR